ncbi:DMT family transporter [Szabonella alba]|uniref:DMT family transporter n=1 Tax=Szabonella alba TaxID=2804194 RepID=A0A8K0V8K0_9RHOB|nr:DMT family transporter [Szabonella alba]MBL4916281.1 DMT family transporter [Szabonella alba]
MLALGFGLTAALLWAVHDLLARKLSQGAGIVAMALIVLASGALALLPLVLLAGDWSTMTGRAWAGAAASGLAFALAVGSLYRAFSLAPVRLVSPVVGSYPMLVLLIAVAQGRPVTPGDWLAVAVIVAGIAIVALAARGDGPEGYAAGPAVATGWAALSALGFAATFALAQEAVRQGSDLPVMLVARITALAAFLILLRMVRTGKGRPPLLRSQIWVLCAMGVLDALSLGFVTVAGGLPKAEYASVASALFGVVTVLLAAWFLHERVRPVQWLGIAVVFTGIGALSLRG